MSVIVIGDELSPESTLLSALNKIKAEWQGAEIVVVAIQEDDIVYTDWVASNGVDFQVFNIAAQQLVQESLRELSEPAEEDFED